MGAWETEAALSCWPFNSTEALAAEALLPITSDCPLIVGFIVKSTGRLALGYIVPLAGFAVVSVYGFAVPRILPPSGNWESHSGAGKIGLRGVACRGRVLVHGCAAVRVTGPPRSLANNLSAGRTLVANEFL